MRTAGSLSVLSATAWKDRRVTISTASISRPGATNYLITVGGRRPRLPLDYLGYVLQTAGPGGLPRTSYMIRKIRFAGFASWGLADGGPFAGNFGEFLLHSADGADQFARMRDGHQFLPERFVLKHLHQ